MNAEKQAKNETARTVNRRLILGRCPRASERNAVNRTSTLDKERRAMMPKGMKESRRAFYLGALRAFLWAYANDLYNASGGSPDTIRMG